jgi:hypothetical protein
LSSCTRSVYFGQFAVLYGFFCARLFGKAPNRDIMRRAVSVSAMVVTTVISFLQFQLWQSKCGFHLLQVDCSKFRPRFSNDIDVR